MGWRRLAMGCMALSVRAPKAMASIVRVPFGCNPGRNELRSQAANSAMRSYPSPEQAAQLSEQIHLGRLGLFDIEDRCGRRCGFGGGRLRVAVEKFLQLLEIFLQRIEQIALV